MENNLSDKTICTVTTGPGADAIVLQVFQPETQSITLKKSDIPFVIDALNLEKGGKDQADYSL